MSTTEKDADKLVASIRKTRSTSTVAAESDAAPTPATDKPAVVKTSAPAKKTTTTKKKVAAKRKTSANPKTDNKKKLVNLFQSSRRVWPD